MGNCGGSEKKDKQIAHGTLRAAERQAIATGKEISPLLREVSSLYNMKKDGKYYFGPRPRDAYWNEVLGRNPDEWKKYLRK